MRLRQRHRRQLTLIVAVVGIIAVVAASTLLKGRDPSPLETFTKDEQLRFDRDAAAEKKAEERARESERTLTKKKLDWYTDRIAHNEASADDLREYDRLQVKFRSYARPIIPQAQAAEIDSMGIAPVPVATTSDAAVKLDTFFRERGSPLDGQGAVILAIAAELDIKQVPLWIGKMQSESHYCLDVAKEIERTYYNCSGLKIKGADRAAYWAAHPELIRNGVPGFPDANGSYLRKFSSYEEYFRTAGQTWKAHYDHLDDHAIHHKWVGTPVAWSCTARNYPNASRRGGCSWLITARKQAALISPLIAL